MKKKAKKRIKKTRGKMKRGVKMFPSF